MTKLRAPLSIENALLKVLGKLGMEGACEATGRAAHYIRALSDPDKREQLTIADALALDLEHQRQGNVGAPIFETYGHLLKAASAEVFTDAAAIGEVFHTILLEDGEANAALLLAQRPGVTLEQLRHALRELEDSIRVRSDAAVILKSVIEHREAPP